MGTWQILYIGMLCFNLVVFFKLLLKYGFNSELTINDQVIKYENPNTHAVVHLVIQIVYFMGGFYSTIGIPQILMVALTAYSIADYFMKMQQPLKYNIISVFTVFIPTILLIWGGFFGKVF
jgi:hypothetical protein